MALFSIVAKRWLVSGMLFTVKIAVLLEKAIEPTKEPLTKNRVPPRFATAETRCTPAVRMGATLYPLL